MANNKLFAGEVVIVTGAGRNLGRACALQLAEAGAKVVVNDANQANPPEAVVEEIKAAGGQAVAALFSVADDAGAKSVVDTALEAFGRLDGLVNNAGTFGGGVVTDVSTADFQSIVDVHLIGSFQMIRHAWPHLLKSPSPRILNTSSGAGFYGLPQMQAYSAAKGGIIGLTHAMSLEGQECGILVNAVAPAARGGDPEFNRARKERGEWGYFDMLLENLGERDQPKFATPLYVYLVSPQCHVTDHFYAAGGGRYARLFIAESMGWTAPGRAEAQLPTPADVAAHFDEVDRTTDAFIPVNFDEAMRLMAGDTAGIATV